MLEQTFIKVLAATTLAMLVLVSSQTSSISAFAATSSTTTTADDRSNEGNVSSEQFDNFGVQEIYPSKPGGPQWYLSMDDGPANDPSIDNIDNLNFKKLSDGSWQVKADNGQVRLEAQSPKNDKWLNVEITAYAKIESTDDELLQLYARGGHHSTKDPCLGSAYKARLYGDGRASWVKEVTHPAYAGNKGVENDVISDSLEGRWVGFKAVVYNMIDKESGDKYVRLESYVDDDVTDSHGNLVVKNNWKLASVYEDKGGWSTNDSDFDSSCGRDRDEVLTGPGGTSSQNLVAWRTDDTVWDFKYLSVREITPSSSSPTMTTATENDAQNNRSSTYDDDNVSHFITVDGEIDDDNIIKMQSAEIGMRRATHATDGKVTVAIVQDGDTLASGVIDTEEFSMVRLSGATAEFDPTVKVKGDFDVVVSYEGQSSIVVDRNMDDKNPVLLNDGDKIKMEPSEFTFGTV